jgi:hypothetical protein
VISVCQILGHRLRHQHAIERIVVVVRQITRRERLLGGDRQPPETLSMTAWLRATPSKSSLPFACLIAASQKLAALTKIGVSGAAIGARTLLFGLVLWLSHQSRTCVSSR